jgi:hypothetical protein
VKDVHTNGFQEKKATKSQSYAQSVNLHIGIRRESKVKRKIKKSKTFLNKTSLIYL